MTKRPSLGGQGPSNLATRAPPLIYKTAAAASKGQSQAQSLAACPTAVTNSSFLWTIASIGATLTLASPLSQPQPPTLALSPLSDSGQNTAHTVCTSLENLKIPAKAGGDQLCPKLTSLSEKHTNCKSARISRGQKMVMAESVKLYSFQTHGIEKMETSRYGC